MFALLFVLASLYAFFDVIVVIGFVASILAGLATGAGALPALFFKSVPARLFNTLLGGAAGVMLAATAFSLIVPAIRYGNTMWAGKGVFAVAAGMLIGALFLDMTDRKLPHLRFVDIDKERSMSLRKIWLFIIAITIHNFPEGLAVGVSFGAGDMHNGVTLALALQDIPEGLAVALSLVELGYSRGKALLFAVFGFHALFSKEKGED